MKPKRGISAQNVKFENNAELPSGNKENKLNPITILYMDFALVSHCISRKRKILEKAIRPLFKRKMRLALS